MGRNLLSCLFFVLLFLQGGLCSPLHVGQETRRGLPGREPEWQSLGRALLGVPYGAR